MRPIANPRTPERRHSNRLILRTDDLSEEKNFSSSPPPRSPPTSPLVWMARRASRNAESPVAFSPSPPISPGVVRWKEDPSLRRLSISPNSKRHSRNGSLPSILNESLSVTSEEDETGRFKVLYDALDVESARRQALGRTTSLMVQKLKSTKLELKRAKQTLARREACEASLAKKVRDINTEQRRLSETLDTFEHEIDAQKRQHRKSTSKLVAQETTELFSAQRARDRLEHELADMRSLLLDERGELDSCRQNARRALHQEHLANDKLKQHQAEHSDERRQLKIALRVAKAQATRANEKLEEEKRRQIDLREKHKAEQERIASKFIEMKRSKNRANEINTLSSAPNVRIRAESRSFQTAARGLAFVLFRVRLWHAIVCIFSFALLSGIPVWILLAQEPTIPIEMPH